MPIKDLLQNVTYAKHKISKLAMMDSIIVINAMKIFVKNVHMPNKEQRVQLK